MSQRMQRVVRTVLGVLAIAGILGAGPAGAGQTCSEKPPTAEAMRKSFGLALKVRQALQATDAQVVLLGRVGQDLSKYGLRYSHIGFLWRDHPEGQWLGVHLLNECGTAVSNLYNQGLANFFADDLFAWDALVLIPSAEIQVRLAKVLAGSDPQRFHEPRYNMVAFAFADRYQNSNQWALEILGEALADRRFASRGEIQQWLKAEGYVPTTLQIPMLSRLGGRMFRANVAFDDHPMDRRMAGQIDTVTVESIAAFLERRDPGSQRQVVSF